MGKTLVRSPLSRCQRNRGVVSLLVGVPSEKLPLGYHEAQLISFIEIVPQLFT